MFSSWAGHVDYKIDMERQACVNTSGGVQREGREAETSQADVRTAAKPLHVAWRGDDPQTACGTGRSERARSHGIPAHAPGGLPNHQVKMGF